MCACGRERNGANGIKTKVIELPETQIYTDSIDHRLKQKSDVAHLREIGREGGREAEEETRMRKKKNVKEWGTQAQKEQKEKCMCA